LIIPQHHATGTTTGRERSRQASARHHTRTDGAHTRITDHVSSSSTVESPNIITGNCWASLGNSQEIGYPQRCGRSLTPPSTVDARETFGRRFRWGRRPSPSPVDSVSSGGSVRGRIKGRHKRPASSVSPFQGWHVPVRWGKEPPCLETDGWLPRVFALFRTVPFGTATVAVAHQRAVSPLFHPTNEGFIEFPPSFIR
jgi:hypothetical protein